LLCFGQRVELAHVEQAEVVFYQAYDAGTMADAEIEVHDGEAVGKTLHQREETGEKEWMPEKAKG
jgi:hypothetical protein